MRSLSNCCDLGIDGVLHVDLHVDLDPDLLAHLDPDLDLDVVLDFFFSGYPLCYCCCDDLRII